MKRLAIALCIFATPVCAADTVDFTVTGSGYNSCAAWLQTPASENEGDEWIFGFWSASNWLYGANHNVGSLGKGTDPVGIIGEVKKVCAERPSQKLATATMETFTRMSSAH